MNKPTAEQRFETNHTFFSVVCHAENNSNSCALHSTACRKLQRFPANCPVSNKKDKAKMDLDKERFFFELFNASVVF